MDQNMQKLAMDWAPFIILIIVYLVMMGRVKNGKGSYYAGRQELLDEQKKTNSLLAEISQKLDKR